MPKFVDLRLCGAISVKPTLDSRLWYGGGAFWKFRGGFGFRVVVGHHGRWSGMAKHDGVTIGFWVHMNPNGGHEEQGRER